MTRRASSQRQTPPEARDTPGGATDKTAASLVAAAQAELQIALGSLPSLPSLSTGSNNGGTDKGDYAQVCLDEESMKNAPPGPLQAHGDKRPMPIKDVESGDKPTSMSGVYSVRCVSRIVVCVGYASRVRMGYAQAYRCV